MPEQCLQFTLPDPEREFRQARLYQQLQRPYDGPPMEYDDRTGAWRAALSPRDARRVEYLFDVQRRDGCWSLVPDAANPRRAPGPYGDKSVVELDGYQPPPWLSAAVDVPDTEPMTVRSRHLGRDLPVHLWTAPGHDAADRLPLLVALDGLELAAYSSLLRLLAQARPVHVALLAPNHRNEEYSASIAFARAIATEVLPAVAARRNIPDDPAGRAAMGVSLGGLAVLHSHHVDPELFGALFLQSGSFFQRRTDPQESYFVRYARITRFVAALLRGSTVARPVPVVITCGTVEENRANNRLMSEALASRSYPVTYVDHPDGHNWVSWRDVLDPHLPALLDTLRR
jgi:enterochelin esterase family protein